MAVSQSHLERLNHLARVVQREAKHLALTDAKLFAAEFSAQRAQSLDNDPDLAERVDAFVSRFGRLQDTLGDKLLPRLLAALDEPVGAAIDNLGRGERLGLIIDAERWREARKLRNQMIHEYIEDPSILSSALRSGHAFVPEMLATATAMLNELDRRQFAPSTHGN